MTIEETRGPSIAAVNKSGFKPRPVALVPALLLLLGSFSVSQGAGVRLLFDVENPGSSPFPTNQLTVADPLKTTGLRVNLPQPSCSEQPSSCAEIGEVNKLDGFSLYPRTSIRFSAPVDLHSLELGISFVWLENPLADEVGTHPAGHRTQINELVWDPATNTAHFKPNEVLDQHRRFLLIATQDVRDEQGDAVERDPAFKACILQPASDYCTELSATVAALDDSPRIVGASLFTTLSATRWMEAAHAELGETPTNYRPAGSTNVFKLSDLTAITVRSETGPGMFDDLTVPSPAFVLPNIDRVAFGVFDSPNYLNEEQVISSETKDAAPVAKGVTAISFHIVVPKGEPPADGYPVAVVGHGLGDNRVGGPTLIADGLAAEGFATIAINAVGHGGGPNSVIQFFASGGTMTEIPLGGRGVDLNGDGTTESNEGCIITSPVPIGLRDCLRQTAIDLMQLVRLIREGVDVDGSGGIPLDGSRIHFVGQSLGALVGTLLLAVEPDVRTAALNVGGATVMNTVRRSETLRNIAIGYLDAHVPTLLNAEGDFNDDYPLRNLPPRVVEAPGALEIQDAFERAEWIQMPGDPLAYAPHLKRSPLPGLSAKPTLFQIARGDLTIRNTENSELIRAAGGRETTQVYRHDIARSAVPTLREDPHIYLVNYEDLFGPGGAVSRAAQTQIAAFLADDGTFIKDVNPLVRDNFGTDIFEFPQVLPDDFGDNAEVLTVSAASLTGPNLAPDSIAAAFASNLATGMEGNDQLPLPTSQLGSTIRIIDSDGRIHYGGFFLLSPMHANFWIPPDVALGPAEVVAASGDGGISRGQVVITSVAPAVFAANGNGKGVAAGQFVSVTAAGERADGLTFDCAAGMGNCVATRIDLGAERDAVYLVLFGTGIRGRSDLTAVRATIGGVELPVLFADAQGGFVGLDQLNLGPIPRSLIGSGEVEIVITVDGMVANTVTVVIL